MLSVEIKFSLSGWHRIGIRDVVIGQNMDDTAEVKPLQKQVDIAAPI